MNAPLPPVPLPPPGSTGASRVLYGGVGLEALGGSGQVQIVLWPEGSTTRNYGTPGEEVYHGRLDKSSLRITCPGGCGVFPGSYPPHWAQPQNIRSWRVVDGVFVD